MKAGGASEPPRQPGAHKCVFAGLARRYVATAMHYIPVVLPPNLASSVFGEPTHTETVHRPQQNPPTDRQRVPG